jgi:hypothetical protein
MLILFVVFALSTKRKKKMTSKLLLRKSELEKLGDNLCYVVTAVVSFHLKRFSFSKHIAATLPGYCQLCSKCDLHFCVECLTTKKIATGIGNAFVCLLGGTHRFRSIEGSKMKVDLKKISNEEVS